MRQPAIKLENLPKEIIKHAQEQVAAALLAGQQDIIMFGYYNTGPESEPPKDPTQTERLTATCTDCGRPIWSTVLKETILAVGSLANVQILCAEKTDQNCCMVRFIQKTNAQQNAVKNIMVRRSDESKGTS